MPLFYFVSAYFCEASFSHGGQGHFVHNKAICYLLPATLVIFMLNPYSQMIANSYCC
jgi:hypothetical protein